MENDQSIEVKSEEVKSAFQPSADFVMPEIEKVSQDDLLLIERANNRLKLLLAESRVAVLEAEKGELQYQNTVKDVFSKYGLRDGDTITTEGVINRQHMAGK